MTYLALTGMLNFLACISLGIFVFLKNKRNIQNIVYFWLNASVALYSLGYFFWQIAEPKNMAVFWFKILVTGFILISLAYLFFVFVFLNIFEQQKRSLAICALLNIYFIAANIHGDLYHNFVTKYNFGYWPEPTTLFNFYLLFWFFQCFYGFFFLVKNANIGSSRRKMQIRYFTLAAIVGFFGGANNWPLWYGLKFPPYANILISVYIGIVAYAIVKHQLMDIEVIVKKTLIFAGLFVAAYAVFASFAYLGSAVFENVVRNRWIAMVPSILIVVLMLRPLESFLRNTTDKYLFQKKYDYRQLLRTFSDEVLMVLDLNMLVNLTVNKLAEIVKLDNASIMLYDEGKEGFRTAASVSGKPENTTYKLSDKEDLISYMRRSGKHILLEDPARKKFVGTDIEKKMHELNAALVIPLMHHKNMVGILSLGQKKSDEEYTQDDIDILLPLARTLSIAITNAQLFEKLSEAQAQAAQREKMAVIGTLSAGINHEICNPLGIARGQCEMFLLNLKDGVYKGKSPEELLEKAQEIMKKVMNETDRATVITKKLSSFAKPAKGEMAGNVQVEKELDEVISLVEHDLKMENIIITKEIKKDLPCISADRKQLQEIFFNIVRNAAQSIKGNGKIVIRASGNNKRVYIDIEDSGVGISKHHLGQIFNPFFTTKEPGRGAGLGLFIVKQIVERNNGHISVQSELGNGTRFSLSFNAVQPS